MLKHQTLCILCKGSRRLCGAVTCPILYRLSVLKSLKKIQVKKEFSSDSPPGFFVGHFNYPQVALGPLVTIGSIEELKDIDETDRWFGKSIDEIVRLRSMLFRSSFSLDVKSSSGRLFENSSLIAMASKPVLTEVRLEKVYPPKISFDDVSAPWGGAGRLTELSIGENPSIHPKVDYVHRDVELKSGEAMEILYRSGFSVSFITRILSAGLIGIGKDRRIVPTRWSITSVDSNLSDILLSEIKHNKLIDSFLLFKSSYLNNEFRVILIPSAWSFEQLEAWSPGTIWSLNSKSPVIIGDHEYYSGRKNYASAVAGAYYSSRLAICEYLSKIKRQAAAIVVREIKPEYTIPVGVWQIRENVRNALKKPPSVYSDLDTVLKAAAVGLNIDINRWLEKSMLYNFFKRQRRLESFFPR